MHLPRLLPSLLTAVCLLSVPTHSEFGWLVFKVDFTAADEMDFRMATDSVVNMLERFLLTNIPDGEFKLVVMSNATNQSS